MSYLIANPNLTSHYDKIHSEATNVHSVWFAHRPEDAVKKIKGDIIFDQGHIKLDNGLSGQPCLIFNPDFMGSKNRKVLMRSPAGVWADVTEATDQEISEIAFGAVVTETLTNREADPAVVFGQALGVLAAALLSKR